MNSMNSYDDVKHKEEVRERMPTATLHYGCSPGHDRFMYRPAFLHSPTVTPTAHRHSDSRPQQSPSLSIYTCDRCMHGFTHASDFLHHKAICMGNMSSPESEAKLRETVQAKIEKIIEKAPENPETSTNNIINFQNIVKSINMKKSGLNVPRPQLSPGACSTITTSSAKRSPRSPGSAGSGHKFGCRYCDKEFDAMYIQNHELTHLLDSPEKPYSCEYCGRAFANLPACQNHERIHTEPRPYICELCSKGFMTAGILKTHMLTHTGQKRFTCEQCSKAFSTAGNLKTHEYIHKGEKPFACGQCGKCFTTAGNLKTHEKIHIGLKPFTCDFCLKAFTTAGNLRTHENIHTGNKPFECDQCHKAFTTAGNLKTHYRLHTGERPYVCSLCSQAYHSSANLRSHQKAQHGIDVTHSETPPHFSPYPVPDSRKHFANTETPAFDKRASTPGQSQFSNAFSFSKSSLPSASNAFSLTKSSVSSSGDLLSPPSVFPQRMTSSSEGLHPNTANVQSTSSLSLSNHPISIQSHHGPLCASLNSPPQNHTNPFSQYFSVHKQTPETTSAEQGTVTSMSSSSKYVATNSTTSISNTKSQSDNNGHHTPMNHSLFLSSSSNQPFSPPPPNPPFSPPPSSNQPFSPLPSSRQPFSPARSSNQPFSPAPSHQQFSPNPSHQQFSPPPVHPPVDNVSSEDKPPPGEESKCPLPTDFKPISSPAVQYPPSPAPHYPSTSTPSRFKFPYNHTASHSFDHNNPDFFTL